MNRIPTEISGLDEMMQGGIPEGHIVLVAGASGSMKSSVSFGMLYNAVMQGPTSGIYVTLEQSKESLRGHMANMGMDVDDNRIRNRIAIIDLVDLRVKLDEQGSRGVGICIEKGVEVSTTAQKGNGKVVVTSDVENLSVKLYNFISCTNYHGEMNEWNGDALITSLKDQSLRKIKFKDNEFISEEVNSVAIAFINSYTNKDHELLASKILREAGFQGQISLSSMVSFILENTFFFSCAFCDSFEFSVIL